MAVENLHTIKGTLYSKDCRKIPNKKKPTEPDWEFYSIKVETKVLINGRTITTIPELQLDKGVSYDEFEVGDAIEVDFFAFGKAISSTWYKSELKAVFIKFSDIQNGNPRRQKTKEESTFTGAVSPKEVDNDSSNDDNLNDLPF